MPSRFIVCTVPTKILLYGAGRLLYPFLNFLTDDWGLTRTEMGYVLAAGEFGGVFAGLLGPCGDIFGDRIVGVISFCIFSISTFLLLLPPTLGGLISSRLLSSVAATVYLIVSQSTLIRITDASSHGLITGISETGWALSILTVIPIVAVAYENLGWRWAFAIFSFFTVPFALEVLLDYPKDSQTAKRKIAGVKQLDDNGGDKKNGDKVDEINSDKDDCNDNINDQVQQDREAQDGEEGDHKAEEEEEEEEEDTQFEKVECFLSFLNPLVNSRYWRSLVAVGARTFNLGSLFFSMSHNLMFISFANWAAEEHGVSESEMGTATVALGIAELTGTLGVIFLADKCGLYRSLFSSLFFYGGFIILFMLIASVSFGAGLASICFVFLAGEFTIVTKIATVDKFVPEGLRGSVLGIQFQAHFIGRTVGALIAESLWQLNGLIATGIAGLVFTFISIVLVGWSKQYFPTIADNHNNKSNTDAVASEEGYIEKDQNQDSGNENNVSLQVF